MNSQNQTFQRVINSFCFLLCFFCIPFSAISQDSDLYKKLSFFLYSPSGETIEGAIPGSFWFVRVKDSERNNLPAHLEIPGRYNGPDDDGDEFNLPVYVAYDFMGSNISSVSFSPEIKKIEDNCFGSCTKLKSVVIPNTVKWVGTFAFKGCTSLTSVVVSPENSCHTSFSGCDIKKGAYPVGKRAFVADIEVAYPIDCIPDSAGLIYNSAKTELYFAPWLVERLDLPASVTNIGPKALAGCTKLKTLRVRSITPPSVSEDAFEGANISLIEVPKGCKELYVNDKNWSMFASVIKEVNTVLILNQTEVRLKSSESVQLTASIENQSLIEGKIVWTSSDEAIATVDSNGLIRARAVGKTMIRATYENLSAECEVTVVPTAVTGIELSSTKEQLKVKQNIRLQASIYPETATDQTVVWSSSNEDVATVDKTGWVYAQSLGNTIITASCGEVKATCEIDVIETLPERVSIDRKCDKLEVNNTFQLRASVYPETTTDQTLIWSSSNNTVATVDESGLVTAHSVGTVIITAKCGNVSGQHTINVVSVPPSSITLNLTSAELKGIDKVQLHATILPTEASGLPVTWTSSDENIVTVDETGLVTSIKPGNAVVTASCESVKATCEIVVREVSVSSISLNYSNVILKKGEVIQLIAEVYPENANDKRVLWSSSDINVVTIESDGKLTAVGVGEAYLAISCNGVIKFCDVTVIDEDAVRIVLNETDISLGASQSFQLKATSVPELTTSQTFMWSSSNESVATVDETGLVTAVSAGETSITATCGAASATCKVTVKAISDLIHPYIYDGINYNIHLVDGTASVSDNSNLVRENLVIPDYIIYQGKKYQVTEIEEYAFGSTLENRNLTGTLTIGRSIKTIGRSAFFNCTRLGGALTIPNSVTLIGDYAFSGCTGFSGTLIIPSSISEISEGVFYRCWGFNALKISDSVISIGSLAFYNCKRFSGSLIIPNSVKTISSHAFTECYGFNGSLTIGESVSVIDQSAFYGCNGFKGSLYISNSVTHIGDNAFYGCSGFTGSLILSNTIREIGEGAFYGCSGFTGSLTIPNSTTRIGAIAFNSCRGLNGDLVIPNSVTSIGDYAFYGCSNLATVKYLAENPLNASVSVFGDYTYSNAVLYALESSIFKYFEVQPWSQFQLIALMDNEGNIIDDNGRAIVIHLNKETLELVVGKNETLTATVVPENATDKTIIWSSDNEDVVTVSEDGMVTAISVGEATITATCGEVTATCNVTVKPIMATTITLNKETLELAVGENETLTATVEPENTTDKTIVWSSSNEKVATVSEDGVVTAISVGTATITAKCGEVSATCEETVKPILATSIIFNKETLELVIGENETLTATVEPENTTDKTIVWSSSNEEVATVSEDGVVTAISVGTVNILATCGELSATCKVTVKPIMATTITLDKETLELTIGEKETLTATVEPENTTYKTIVWSSSNNEVATVSEDGVVTANSVGEATITATCSDVTATCTVTVSPRLVESIGLNYSEWNGKLGESLLISATVSPDNATDKTLLWSSSDTEVATVDETGQITAVNVGECTVTATAADGSDVSASCKITVSPRLVESIGLNYSEWNGKPGESLLISATVSPDNATDKTLLWSSSDTEVATVDETGQITAVNVGECIVTATAADGSEISASCTVTVSPRLVESIELDRSNWIGMPGESFVISVTVSPDNATDRTVA